MNKKVYFRIVLKMGSLQQQYAKGIWDSVIIETNKGKRFELVQFNYFQFDKLFNQLERFGYSKSGTIVRLSGLFKTTEEYLID